MIEFPSLSHTNAEHGKCALHEDAQGIAKRRIAAVNGKLPAYLTHLLTIFRKELVSFDILSYICSSNQQKERISLVSSTLSKDTQTELPYGKQTTETDWALQCRERT